MVAQSGCRQAARRASRRRRLTGACFSLGQGGRGPPARARGWGGGLCQPGGPEGPGRPLQLCQGLPGPGCSQGKLDPLWLGMGARAGERQLGGGGALPFREAPGRVGLDAWAAWGPTGCLIRPRPFRHLSGWVWGGGPQGQGFCLPLCAAVPLLPVPPPPPQDGPGSRRDQGGCAETLLSP